jgi:hypothetical protein
MPATRTQAAPPEKKRKYLAAVEMKQQGEAHAHGLHKQPQERERERHAQGLTFICCEGKEKRHHHLIRGQAGQDPTVDQA